MLRNLFAILLSLVLLLKCNNENLAANLPKNVGKEPSGKWGVVVDGLRCSVEASKESYQIGEPIDLVVAIENVSGKPRTMNNYISGGDPSALKIIFEIFASNGEKVEARPDKLMEKTDKYREKNEFFNIPGIGISLKYKLDKINVECEIRRGKNDSYWALNEYLASKGFPGRLLMDCQHYKMKTPGKYRIIAKYINANDGSSFNIKTIYGRKAWVGALSSNAITVKVVGKESAVSDDFFEVRPVDESGKKAGYTKMKINSTGEELFVANRVIINMADVQSCRQKKDLSGAYSVIMTLTPEGSNKFSHFTADYIGERAAIFLDSKIVIAPKIMDEIKGPDVLIGGRLSEKEAKELVRKMTVALK